MSIPILGLAEPPRISPQQRLNVSDTVGRLLAETRAIGLQHGRLILRTPADRTSAEFLLYFDALLDAGCVLVSVCEHPNQDPNGSVSLVAHILFRLPRETTA